MSNRNGPTKKTLLIVTLLGVAVVASMAAYVKFSPQKPVEGRADRAPSVIRHGPDVKIERDGKVGAPVRVFLPHYDNEVLSFESKEEQPATGEDARVFAVNWFLRHFKAADPAAKLLSIDVKDGVATLSFNGAILSGYGTDDEHTLLDGIRTSLGQFAEIQKIEFFADGKAVDTFGNIELGEPVEVIRSSTPGEETAAPKPN